MFLPLVRPFSGNPVLLNWTDPVLINGKIFICTNIFPERVYFSSIEYIPMSSLSTPFAAAHSDLPDLFHYITAWLLSPQVWNRDNTGNCYFTFEFLPMTMTAISHRHFHEWKVLYFDSNSTEVCSKGSNWSALVLIMTWCQIGNKPLPEPTLTQFTDSYMRH